MELGPGVRHVLGLLNRVLPGFLPKAKGVLGPGQGQPAASSPVRSPGEDHSIPKKGFPSVVLPTTVPEGPSVFSWAQPTDRSLRHANYTILHLLSKS